MKRTKKKKDLGIFYTPQSIVDLIISSMLALTTKEDKVSKRWSAHSPPHYPSIIDPACGEGIFLKSALAKKLTNSDYVFGVDLDHEAVSKWEAINILSEFEGDDTRLQAHFFYQNGLNPLDLDQHKKFYSGKVRWKYLQEEQFDCVLGNPPYGGMGIADFDLPVNKGLANSLDNYSIWKSRKGYQKNKPQASSLFDIDQSLATSNQKIKKNLEKYPIEILFIERFIQLAKSPTGNKSGGKIAIVLPEGIFANSTLHYVRKYISEQTKVLGIISLPRDTFKGTGTNAKTSILILEKISKPISDDYPIFLASLDKLVPENFAIISNRFKEWIMNSTAKQVVDDENGLMIRVDKTLADLNTEKPSSRWDPSYWHPKYEDKIVFSTEELKSLLTNEEVISVDHMRASQNENEHAQLSDNYPAFYYTVDGIEKTGYNTELKRYISSNGYQRLSRGELANGDLALAISGTGSLGKSFIKNDNITHNTTGDLYVLKINKKLIDPYLIYLLFQTPYVKKQINRHEKGVSGQTKLTKGMVESFKIPILPSKVQTDISKQSREVSNIHLRAMKAKAKNDTSAYESNIQTAEKMLRDLISRTEAVIRGEREDVV